jgi:putative ABC transport system substrate-binding protein
MATAGDPVAQGLVDGLARPGGNVTGLSQMTHDLTGKRLELLTEIVPKLSRVAVLGNQGVNSVAGWKEIQPAARKLGVELHWLEVRSPRAFDSAFEEAIKLKAGAVYLTSTGTFSANLKQIADLAAKSRIPAIYHRSEFADAGGLMSYGPDRADMFRRAAGYVDKILKGAKPADLPVEQPVKFELVLNSKTAKALGVTVPQSILVRVDRVIE